MSLEKHLEKTFIGRIEKGSHFLGYHFSRTELTVARATLENFAARAIRLYGQEPTRLGEYVERWLRWAQAGVEGKTRRDTGGDNVPLHGTPLLTAGGNTFCVMGSAG